MLPHKSCIIGNEGIIFIPRELMKVDQMTILKNVSSDQCQAKIIIYGGSQYPQYFVSYNCAVWINYQRPRQFDHNWIHAILCSPQEVSYL